MSLVDVYHAEHKARLARMGGIAQPAPVAPVKPKPKKSDVEDDRIAALLGDLERMSAQLDRVIATVRDQASVIASISKHVVEVSPRFTEIMDAVCAFYHVSHTDLASARRTGELIRPRQVSYYLGRKMTGLSFPQMAARLGDRDHTTLLWGANKIARQIKTDGGLAEEVDAIEAKVAARILARQIPQRGQP